NHGVIEQYGTASELYYQPSSKFVADFLGGGSYLAATRISDTEYETHIGVVEASAQQEIQMQSACSLLLRPQHVQIQSDEDSAVTVLEQHFMGDHCRYVIDANGDRLLAIASQPLYIGERVAVKIETQGVLAFA
ncbi:TOBE domain-containing protein, partial [Vibrio sp. Vb0349]|uniref:TOBE domain-containing protein n=1 Tax=Vibrio sp. Vb0349 TaxID=3074624 RepID=UPI002964ADF0